MHGVNSRYASHPSQVCSETPKNSDELIKSQRVQEQFSDGRALVKMLERDMDDFERTDTELSELVCEGRVRCSSTSLLVHGIPSKIYRDVGFIIDADKVYIRHISPSDIYSSPLDENGDRIHWSSKDEKFGFGRSVRKFHGRYYSPCKSELLSIFELKTHLENIYRNGSKILDWNELIINYDCSSIMGCCCPESR